MIAVTYLMALQTKLGFCMILFDTILCHSLSIRVYTFSVEEAVVSGVAINCESNKQ
jgi:hypothetical protein